MLSLSSAGWRLALGACAGLAANLLLAGSAFTPQGTEYSLTRGLLGDQTNPQLSLTKEGGYVVWEDNSIDGDGTGIGAAGIDSYYSPDPSRFLRVNEQTTGSQEKPAVQVLKGGGAIFVWQGGPQGQQDIWARIIGRSGTFLTGDLLVNTFTEGQQVQPVLALLPDGSVVVAWSSFGQDGSMQGVFAQRLSPAGEKMGVEFQVNQFTNNNQRTPAIATLNDGDFIVTWVSEMERYQHSVDIYARRFDPAGAARGHEFLVNSATNVCANPSVSSSPAGGFVVAWSERNQVALTNGWDVMGRSFGVDGQSASEAKRLNAFTVGNQYGPKLATVGSAVVAVWTSEFQDGSREEIYGRFIGGDASFLSEEFRVNTATISRQIHPAVASDGEGRVLTAWASFVGGDASFEVLGQRYVVEQVLVQPTPPLVLALDSYSLLVSWPPLAGYTNLVSYQLYKDGGATPVKLTDNFLVVSDLDSESTHTFRIAYELAGGLVSPVSEVGMGKTWGRDRNFDGLPDDWQAKFWGTDSKKWPASNIDSDGDGASNLYEFLAGTDPTSAQSVLKLGLKPTTGGMLVQYSAVPGSIYQLQFTTDLIRWNDQGSPQFAAGLLNSAVIPSTTISTYYRVIRVR